MNTWIVAKIIKIKKWENNLFSLILQANIDPFIAGQFTKLGYPLKNGKIIQRAYSFVNTPDEKFLEFYMILIKNGQFTSQIYNLKKLDELKIKKQSSGFFTLDHIHPCEKLWMLSTGTGIGPYLSILKNKKNTEKFNKIILIHAVRYKKDLSYLNDIYTLKKNYNGKLKIKFIISREKTNFSLIGRIPQLLETQELEKNINLYIEKNNSHVMLCGNPNMIQETKNILIKKRNLTKNLKRKPGDITSEHYW